MFFFQKKQAKPSGKARLWLINAYESARNCQFFEFLPVMGTYGNISFLQHKTTILSHLSGGGLVLECTFFWDLEHHLQSYLLEIVSPLVVSCLLRTCSDFCCRWLEHGFSNSSKNILHDHPFYIHSISHQISPSTVFITKPYQTTMIYPIKYQLIKSVWSSPWSSKISIYIQWSSKISHETSRFHHQTHHHDSTADLTVTKNHRRAWIATWSAKWLRDRPWTSSRWTSWTSRVFLCFLHDASQEKIGRYSCLMLFEYEKSGWRPKISSFQCEHVDVDIEHCVLICLNGLNMLQHCETCSGNELASSKRGSMHLQLCGPWDPSAWRFNTYLW